MCSRHRHVRWRGVGRRGMTAAGWPAAASRSAVTTCRCGLQRRAVLLRRVQPVWRPVLGPRPRGNAPAAGLRTRHGPRVWQRLLLDDSLLAAPRLVLAQSLREPRLDGSSQELPGPHARKRRGCSRQSGRD